MNRTWIVVANSARARLCEFNPRDGSLTEMAGFVHTEGRQKGSDLGHDRPGQAAKGQASTSFEPHTEVHHKERMKFAQQLAKHLDDAVAEHRCPAVALIASNPFLGELKGQLAATTAKAVVATAPSDLTNLDLRQLASRVGQMLEAPR